MASRPETNAIGGVWPLGTFTITSGTPVSIMSIVGANLPSTAPAGRVFSPNCRQLLISTAGNAGLIYLNDGNYPGKDVNRTVAIIGPNMPNVAFPPSHLADSVLDMSRYWVDGTNSGDTITIAAADASN